MNLREKVAAVQRELETERGNRKYQTEELEKAEAERDAIAAEAGAMKELLAGHDHDGEVNYQPGDCAICTFLSAEGSAPASREWMERHDRDVRAAVLREAARDVGLALSEGEWREGLSAAGTQTAFVTNAIRKFLVNRAASVERGAQEGEAT